jgi:signal peptidase I
MHRPRRPGRRAPLTIVRLIVECALVIVVLTGLGGVVLGRVMPALGHQVFVVAGPSMEPAIPVGSAVILDAIEPAALRVGDVVSLRSGPDRAIFTHRVIRIAEREGELWLETRGDANAGPDPSITPVAAVVGRVSVVVPAAGYLLTLSSTPVGVLLILSVGATLIVLGWLLESIALERRRHASLEPTSPSIGVPAPAVPGRPAPTVRRRPGRRARPTSDVIAAERRRHARARLAGRSG